MALVTSNLPLIIKRRQGNVGIGTNIPLRTFHVEGDMRITGNIYDAYDQPFSSGGGGGSANLQWRPAPVYPQIVAPTMGTIAGLQFNTVYRYSGNEIVYHLDHAVRVVAQTNDLTRNYTMDLPVPFSSNAYYTGNVLGEFWLKVSSNEYATTYKAFARASPSLSNQLYLRYVSGTTERSWSDFAADYTLAFSGVISYQTEEYYMPTPVSNPILSANFSQDSVGNIVINGGGWAPRARLDVIQANCNLPVLIADQQAVQSVDIFQARRNTITKFAVTGAGDLVVTGNVYNCNYQPLWLPATAVEWNNAVDPVFTVPDGMALAFTSNSAKYRFAGQEVAYQFSTIATLTGSASNVADNLELTIAPYFSQTAYPTSTIVGDLWVTASNAGNTTLYQGYARTIPNTNGEKVSLRYLNSVYDRSFTDFSTNTILDIRGTLLYESSNSSFYTVPQVYTPARMKQDADGRIIVSQIESAPAGRFHIKEASSEPVMIIEQTGVGQGDIFQYRSNEVTRFVVNRAGNIGVGTTTAWHPLDIMGNMRITGNILNASNEAVWIAGTTVQWKQSDPASYVLPAGASMTYTASNASFRYIGNEIIYNFVLSGVVNATPSTPNEDYCLQLQYPLEMSAYPTDKIIGDLWFNVTSNVTSTTYKAYAKASNVSAFSDRVAVRFLNGALDLPISSIAVGSTTTLQGTLIYQTPHSANSQPVPLATFKQLLQDQDDNLLLNSDPSDVSIARFSVFQTSNQPALLLHDRANLGANPATADIMQVRRNNVPIFNIRQNGDVRITGNILDTNSNATWIPGSTIEWKQAYAPTLNFPAGIGFAYTTSNATYRYIGNEIVYNFNITGTVSGTASAPTSNYTLNLTYPLKASAYPTETMIGSIMMGVYTSTGSNTYAAFAKTLPVMPTPADTYLVNLRYLNGTYERSLTDVQANSTLKLQGQLTYTTPFIANNVQVPIAYTQSTFTQDQVGNVIFNGGGNAPQGTFEIRSTSNAPALIVNQTTSSNTSDILELKQNNAIKVVVDAQGNVGIGTMTPMSKLAVNGSASIGTYSGTPIPANSLIVSGNVGIGTTAPTTTLQVQGDVVASGTVSSGTGLMFRNRIINGCMRFNQRGTSTSWASPAAGSTSVNAADTRYVTDRWTVYRGGFAAGGVCNHGTDLTYSDLPFSATGLKTYARFGRVSGNTSTALVNLAYALESQDSYRFTGQTVTLSFYCRTGASFSGTYVASICYGTGIDEYFQRGNGFTGLTSTTSSVAASTSWQRITVSGTAPTTTTQIAVQIYYAPSGTAGANEYIDITGVQLEKGTIATPFEFRPYSVELQLCQRYFEAFSTSYGTLLGYGNWYAATNAFICIPFKTTKRVGVTLRTSSLTFTTNVNTSSLNIAIVGSGMNYVSAIEIAGFGSSQHSMVLWVTSASGIANAPTFLVGQTGVGVLGADAEL